MLKNSVFVCFLMAVLITGCTSKRPTVSKNKRSQQSSVVDRTVDKRKPRTERMEEVEKNVTPPNAPYSNRVENYIAQYKGIAKEEMLQYGIPASIKLAQGILESGAGAGELALKSNNHFGIKCHEGWEGGRVYHDDDSRGECFRKYNDPKYSFRDHSLFLAQRSRYSDLFTLRKNDYIGWALGLKRAGYATDPSYPQKLIGLIERYNLQKYDEEALGLRDPDTDGNQYNSESKKIETYHVQAGDTLYSIARKFELTVETLKKYNGLTEDAISIGQVLYLNPTTN